MQIKKFTIIEDEIIPITPKLYGEIVPKFFIGAPIKNQSKKTFSTIPTIDS